MQVPCASMRACSYCFPVGRLVVHYQNWPSCRTATIALYPLPKAVLSNSGHLRSGGWAGDEDSIMGTERRDDVAGEHYYGQI